MSNIYALLGSQLRQPDQSKLPGAHPDSSCTGQKHTTGVALVPAADLSPGVVSDRMLCARYFNTNSNSSQKLFSTKKATTEQTF